MHAHIHSGPEGSPTDDVFFHEVINPVDRTVIPCPWDAVFLDCVPVSGSTHDELDVGDGYGFPDFQSLVDSAVADGLFLDMHTEKFLKGEIRAQLMLVQHGIYDLFAPTSRSKLKADSTVPIKFKLTDADGIHFRITDTHAAELLSPTCRVMFSASGAQNVGPTCVRYEAATHQFSYIWKVGKTTGPETITVTVGYPSTSFTTTRSKSITIAK